MGYTAGAERRKGKAFRCTALSFLFLLTAIPCTAQTPAEVQSAWWWPEQQAPAKVVKCRRPAGPEEQMLAQSVAGLAARAVNENISDEMVWIETAIPQYAEWYAACIRRLRAQETGTKSAWELAEKYRQQGIIEGFVLYSRNTGSVNTATVYAGLKRGILVEESLMDEALSRGFALLLDARQTDLQTCFAEESVRLNRRLMVVVSPSAHNNRDMAIAHQSMVYYGVDAFYLSLLEWMQPISPIVGWNTGGESEHVEPPSRYGHFNTASDFSVNLTLLSAGAREAALPKIQTVDPKQIDFSEDGNFHAFVMSDGDNMQWTMNAFFSAEYYGNACAGVIPTGWTSCPANTAMMCPDVWAKIVDRQATASSIAEFSGGYQYLDLFADLRPERWDIVREYARKTNVHMKRSGVKVVHFMTRGGVLSDNAKRAYRIYAEEIEDLTGIIAIQYNPYHGGGGAIEWVQNRAGVNIPVVTARYSMWGKLAAPGFGRPDRVAEMVNADATATTESPAMYWTVVHAWSRYKMQKDGAIVDVDNDSHQGSRGLTPVKWCIDRIDPLTKVVTVEELLWRIRMKRYPEQTKGIIEQ
jgi:hypothetical protein